MAWGNLDSVYYSRYYPRTETFEQAEALYEKIEPVKFQRRDLCRIWKKLDVRPIAKRSRTWERVVKLSKYAYGFDAGHSYLSYFHHPQRATMNSELECPIVWRKYRGKETLIVRLPSGGNIQSYQRFMRGMLPSGVAYYTNEARPVLEVNRVEYGLLPTVRGEQHKVLHDRHALVFTRSGAREPWEYVKGKYVDVSGPRRYIDTEEKAKYTKNIREFKSWVAAVFPLVSPGHPAVSPAEVEEYASPETSGLSWWKVRNLLNDRSRAGEVTGDTGPLSIAVPVMQLKHRRAMLTDTQHPLRMVALRLFKNYVADCWPEPEVGTPAWNKCLNRFINYWAEFAKVTRVK